MAGLQRFITYIYKYENEEKKENAGFAKIEIRGGMCRVEVHIRNVSVKELEVTVYLFKRQDGQTLGAPLGNMSLARGAGDVRYAFETKELSNFGMKMEDMEGIFIPFQETTYLASQWKEGKIDSRQFHRVEKEEAKEDLEKTKSPVEEVEVKREAKEEDAAKQTRDKEEETAQDFDTKASDADKEEQEPIQATELPLEAFSGEQGLEGIFQKLRLKLEIFYPFEGEEIECLRMQLNDIKEFPRKYWYIGNNSFLLHGFFNYKHIIFGEMEENGTKKYLIGVPGVFQNQERVMAAMFGFPEFRTAKKLEYKTGNFGYWYRII